MGGHAASFAALLAVAALLVHGASGARVAAPRHSHAPLTGSPTARDLIQKATRLEEDDDELNWDRDPKDDVVFSMLKYLRDLKGASGVVEENGSELHGYERWYYPYKICLWFGRNNLKTYDAILNYLYDEIGFSREDKEEDAEAKMRAKRLSEFLKDIECVV